MQYIPYIYYIYLPTTCSCWISIMQNRVQRKKKLSASETIITPSWETKSCEKRLVKFYENLIWNGASQLTEPKRMRYIYDMMMIIQLLIPNRASYHIPHWISRPQLLLRANMANRAKCLYIITNYNIPYYSVCSFISFFVTVTNCIFIIFLLSLNTDRNIFVTNCCNVFELIRKSNK